MEEAYSVIGIRRKASGSLRIPDENYHIFLIPVCPTAALTLPRPKSSTWPLPSLPERGPPVSPVLSVKEQLPDDLDDLPSGLVNGGVFGRDVLKDQVGGGLKNTQNCVH